MSNEGTPRKHNSQHVAPAADTATSAAAINSGMFAGFLINVTPGDSLVCSINSGQEVLPPITKFTATSFVGMRANAASTVCATSIGVLPPRVTRTDFVAGGIVRFQP